MPKGKDLGLQRGSSSKAWPNGRKQRENDREHGFRKLSWRRYKFNGSISTEFLVGQDEFQAMYRKFV